MGPPGWWEAKFDINIKRSCREHLFHSGVTKYTKSLSVGLPWVAMSCHSFCTKGMARLHMDTCHELRFRPAYG